jgi:sterol desaturase/sphingolipid hydroxylase (fatty acid hydroxylase superfamily)
VTFDWRSILSGAIGLSIAAGLVLAVEELLWLKRRRRLTRPALREMAMSLSTLPPNIIVSLVAGGWWFAIYAAASELVPWRMPMNVATLLLAVVVGDLCYYWEHRSAHRFPVLWAGYHAVHHSSSGYTVATAYRVSFVNQLIAPAFYLPCIALGVPPLLVVGLQVLSIHYQAWVHTEMIGPLGALDRVLNTPANHRMHHDVESLPRAVNFGGILVLWDRLFGTYAPACNVRQYGIPGLESPHAVLAVYCEPWVRALHGRRSRDTAANPEDLGATSKPMG